MYPINKQIAPNSLTEYRFQIDASYSNLPSTVKKQIKDLLLEEQGYVCAYCMTRIKFDDMRLEHWASQTDHKELQLDYNNMLACCHGNEGQSSDLYICDKKKGDRELKYSPSNVEHSIKSRIYYQGNGKVRAYDEDFDQQLENVLNLNQSRLVANRNAALDVIHDKLNISKGTRTKQQVEALQIQVLARNKQNKHKPYFGFLSWYLQSKL